jgi:hypothetical protein
MIETPYTLFERLRLVIETHRGQILDEDFAAEVTVTARFAAEDVPPFESDLQELSHGTLQAVVIETDAATIMFLGPGDQL